MKRNVVCLAVVAALLPAVAHAGPCASLIDETQKQVDAFVDKVAGSGPTAPESTDATLGREPTPGTIAQEETELGEGGPSDRALAELESARQADANGDMAGCQAAIAKARKAIGL